MDVAALRALVMFSLYLLACVVVTLLVSRSLCLRSKRSPYRPHGLRLFTSLAAISVAVTWYYVYCFFRASYHSWAVARYAEIALHSLHTAPRNLGVSSWLRDTALFKEIWEAAVLPADRWWWTQQVLLATAPWSLFVAVEGHRRNVPLLWAYVLLGQLVAVSFAANLFFLAILLHPVQAPSPELEREKLRGWVPSVYTTLYAAVAAVIYFLPTLLESKSTTPFVAALLALHALLFVPLFVHPREAGWETREYWGRLYMFQGLAAAFSHWAALREVVSYSGFPQGLDKIGKALWGNPAVSSLGLDAVLLAVSVGAWQTLHNREWRLATTGIGRGGRVKSALAGLVLGAVGSAGQVSSGFASELENALPPLPLARYTNGKSVRRSRSNLSVISRSSSGRRTPGGDRQNGIRKRVSTSSMADSTYSLERSLADVKEQPHGAGAGPGAAMIASFEKRYADAARATSSRSGAGSVATLGGGEEEEHEAGSGPSGTVDRVESGNGGGGGAGKVAGGSAPAVGGHGSDMAKDDGPLPGGVFSSTASLDNSYADVAKDLGADGMISMTNGKHA